MRSTLPALLALFDLSAGDTSWQALDPTQRRQRTLDAVKRLILRESQVQPLVLVFEDLHWIDSETQAFLDSLLESLPTARLLLLVNYRPEYRHDWGSKTYYRQLQIEPLPFASAVGIGRLGHRMHTRAQAHEHLIAATALYREMDMRFWLEQAAKVLEALA